MRLFLDAHVSGKRIARSLRRRDHDVRAADEERALDGMTDEELLALATRERRILVTFNAADAAFDARSKPDDWADYCCFVTRRS